MISGNIDKWEKDLEYYIAKIINQLRVEQQLEFQIEYIEKAITHRRKKHPETINCRFMYEHVRHLYGFGVLSSEMIKIFNEWNSQR